MKLAFTPPAGSSGADFTAMAKARELFIASVVHKAFVEVNEKGTEAAAATAVTMRATAAPMDEPVEFKADRPFVFVIHDVDLKTILFVGRVTEPSMKLQG